MLVFMIAAMDSSVAQTEKEVAEYNIKAAFLYKFASYVEWPPGAFDDEASPLVFGILGADLLTEQLEEIVRGRRINGREIRVRSLRAEDQIDGLHVLFIGRSHGINVDEVLHNAADKSVLTVTETAPTSRSGSSIINFNIIDDKVRFDVSLAPAQRGRLQISSRLLQVADRILNEVL